MKRPGQCTPKVTKAVIEITEICCNYTVAWKEYDFCKPFKQECWSKQFQSSNCTWSQLRSLIIGTECQSV